MRQAPEAAILHAIGGTADIEIDLVIAEALALIGRFRKCFRLRAAKLQSDRMLVPIET